MKNYILDLNEKIALAENSKNEITKQFKIFNDLIVIIEDCRKNAMGLIVKLNIEQITYSFYKPNNSILWFLDFENTKIEN